VKLGQLIAFPSRMKTSVGPAVPAVEALSDLGLAAACAAGDEAARALLVERHVDAVHAFVSRMRGAEGAAGDLVQMTFLAAFESAAKFRGPALKSWLFGIAANLVRSHIRTDIARNRALARLEVVVGDSVHDPRVAERYALQCAIDRLPPRLREAIVLVDLGGERAVDVARALAIPEGTLWRRLSEAREMLRQILDADDGGAP
jgi:RNA polymerase sigma-70 factor (ECF subfamily)